MGNSRGFPQHGRAVLGRARFCAIIGQAGRFSETPTFVYDPRDSGGRIQISGRNDEENVMTDCYKVSGEGRKPKCDAILADNVATLYDFDD